MDLIFMVDVSGSMDNHLPNVSSFIAELLSHFVISTTDMQVALIRFARPAVLDWNLQSAETANYSTLITNIDWTLNDTDTIGDINGGFEVALDEVLDSDVDRPNVVDVVMVCGDGDSSPSVDELEEMRQHAR